MYAYTCLMIFGFIMVTSFDISLYCKSVFSRFLLFSLILSFLFFSDIFGYNKNSGAETGVFPPSYDMFILYTAYLLYAVFTFFWDM